MTVKFASKSQFQTDEDKSNLKIEKAPTKSFRQYWKKNKKKIIPLIILIGYILFAFVGSAIVGDPDYIYYQNTTGSNLYFPRWLEPFYKNSILYQNGLIQFTDLPLGTTNEGKSWFSILVHSLKNSLIIGATAGLVCVFIAVFIGLIGPFVGGIIDDFFVFITNVFLVFPVIPFIILLSTWFQSTSIWHIILVIALFNWPWAARSIRSQVLSLRERDFIKIAKVTGRNPLITAVEDIMPNMFSYIFLVFTILINVAILTEAGIAVLGIGQTKIWTLGRMLNTDRAWHISPGYYHLWLPTGLVLTSFLVLMYVINTNWQSVFNPRLRDN